MSKAFMEVALGILFLTLAATVAILGLSGKVFLDEYVAQQKVQAQHLQELVATMLAGKDIVLDASAAVVARSLEKEGIMTPSDADKVVTESLEGISSNSKRMGHFARLISDYYTRTNFR